MDVDRALLAIADSYHDFIGTRCSKNGVEPTRDSIKEHFHLITDTCVNRIPADRLFIYNGTIAGNKHFKGQDLEETIFNLMEHEYSKTSSRICTQYINDALSYDEERIAELRTKILDFLGDNGNIGIIYDQFGISILRQITDDLNSDTERKILNIHPICGLWDEAGKSKFRRIDVKIKGVGGSDSIDIDHTGNIQFGLNFNDASTIFRANSDGTNSVAVFNQEIIGPDSKALYPINNVFYDTELSKEVLDLSVNALCRAFSEAGSKNETNILNIILGVSNKNASFIKKDADIYVKAKTLFSSYMFSNLGHLNIKRSGDFGQVAMVKYLNEKNVTVQPYAAFDENKRPLDIVSTPNISLPDMLYVLMTSDRLCCTRALMEGVPVIFYSKKKNEIILYKNEQENVITNDYYNKLIENIFDNIYSTGIHEAQEIIVMKLQPVNDVAMPEGPMTFFSSFFRARFSNVICQNSNEILDRIYEMGARLDDEVFQMCVSIHSLVQKIKVLQNTLITDKMKSILQKISGELQPRNIITPEFIAKEHLELFPFILDITNCKLPPETNILHMDEKDHVLKFDDDILTLLQTISLYPSMITTKDKYNNFQGIVRTYIDIQLDTQYSKYIDLYHNIRNRHAKDMNGVITCLQNYMKKRNNMLLRGYVKNMDGLHFFRPIDAYMYVFESQTVKFIDLIHSFIDDIESKIELCKSVNDLLCNTITPSGSEMSISKVTSSCSMSTSEGEGGESKKQGGQSGGKCDDKDVMDLNILLCNCKKYIDSYIVPDEIEDIQIAMNQIMYCFHIPVNSWIVQSSIIELFDLCTGESDYKQTIATKADLIDVIKKIVFSVLRKYTLYYHLDTMGEQSDPYDFKKLFDFCLDYRKHSLVDISTMTTEFFEFYYQCTSKDQFFNYEHQKSYKDFVSTLPDGVDIPFVEKEIQFMHTYMRNFMREVYLEINRESLFDQTSGWSVILQKYTNIQQASPGPSSLNPSSANIAMANLAQPCPPSPLPSIIAPASATASPEKPQLFKIASTATMAALDIQDVQKEPLNDRRFNDFWFKIFIETQGLTFAETCFKLSQIIAQYAKDAPELKTVTINGPKDLIQLKYMILNTLKDLSLSRAQSSNSMQRAGGGRKCRLKIREYHQKYYPAYYNKYYVNEL